METFAARLREQLLPVYLVSGDEPLLVGEATDAIRARARAEGYGERETFFMERGSNWDDVRQAAQALSLFSSRRIVEIRLPTGRPGAGAGALLQLINAADADLLVLIITQKLEREVQNSEWVQAAQTRGAWLPVWPVDRAHFAQWLRARLRAAGFTAEDAALAMLAARTEGNLLAARQEIEKLSLLAAGPAVTVADVAASSGDSARFDVFQLGEAVLGGDAARALRILAGLRAEGAEAVLVLWSLIRELRTLAAAARGAAPQRGWGRPSAAAEQGRLRAPRLPYARLTARAVRADRVAKGMAYGDAWDEMALLATELCGLRALALP